MEIKKDEKGFFVLLASSHELLIINNALNEICNGLPLRDFETRVGAPLADAESLLKLVGKALDQ